MEKKKISIIGTCVTREVFNDPRLEEVFDIDMYAFKVCPFSLLDESLNIPYSEITKAPVPEFDHRNLDYDLNKNLMNKIKEKDSEYIAVDLYSLIVDPIFYVSYKNKNTYIQTARINENIIELKKILGNNFQYQKVIIDELSQDMISNGLEKFAELLNSFAKKVIVFIPTMSKQFFSFDYQVLPYSENKLKQFEIIQEKINNYSKIFTKKLNKPTIIRWCDNYTAKNIYTDYSNFYNKKFEPQTVHLTIDGYSDVATKILKSLKIDYRKYYTKGLEPFSYQFEQIGNRKSQLTYFQEKSFKDILCSLNAYTNYLLTLKHHLIVFSVQADCQAKIKYWRNRKKLGLNFSAVFRDSYIGIVNTKNGFRYENKSKNALTYDYKIPELNENVFVESHGFYATNFSSIKYKGKELSKGKRGFNIAVIDLDTGNVVDTANCDSCLDEFLLVESDFLSMFKSK